MQDRHDTPGQSADQPKLTLFYRRSGGKGQLARRVARQLALERWKEGRDHGGHGAIRPAEASEPGNLLIIKQSGAEVTFGMSRGALGLAMGMLAEHPSETFGVRAKFVQCQAGCRWHCPLPPGRSMFRRSDNAGPPRSPVGTCRRPAR